MRKAPIATIAIAATYLLAASAFGQILDEGNAIATTFFRANNLVVVLEGCGVHGGTCSGILNGKGTGGSYGDNQGGPLTLFQYTPTGTSSVAYVNSLVFPQLSSGANTPVSGEYGSSSEGTLQLSGGGQYLTIMGYGINSTQFNAFPLTYVNQTVNPGITALAQSTSLTTQNTYTPVPRVVALIDANGNVNSSTLNYNVFDLNNPRSAYTGDGTNIYISGQGNSPDHTGGVFLTTEGTSNNAPTAITGDDASDGHGGTQSQDTRTVQIVNNTLYVSIDTKEGSGSAKDFIGTLGAPPATGLYNSAGGPTPLNNFGAISSGKDTGKVTITTGANSTGNNLNAGYKVNLSPVNYFFASASVVYVADSGVPKNDSNNDNNNCGSSGCSTGTANIGDGGLQKWVNSQLDGSGSWSLAYTLCSGLGGPGLGVVNNSNAHGTSGLYGLAGVVNADNTTVSLYATNYTLSDLDPTYLYGITDTRAFTTASQAAGETFTLLDTAPAGSNFKGVSFTPAIPAGSVELTSAPAGLALTTSGAGCAPGTYTTPITLAWTPNSSCTLSVASSQTAQGVTYGFVQWQDATTASSDVVIAPSGTATYTATFAATSSPGITWPAPAAVTYGSALSGEQLNATGSLGAGNFVYVPPAGTVLPVGTNTLTVYYTPAGTTTTISATTAITVNPAPPPATPVNLVVTNQLARVSGNVVVTLSIANTGGTAANNVTLSTLSIGGKAGTPLPQSIGTIGAGSSAQVTVTVPGSVGASGAASTISLSGSYTGGSFNSGGRVKLP